MSGVRLEISIDDGGLGRAMRRAIELGSNLRPALEASGQLIETGVIQRFETESGPGGIKWRPSKAALGLAPRASGKISPGLTLTDTGALRSSIQSAVSETEVEVGSARNARGNVRDYAAAHQFGFSPGGIPARPFLGFDDQDVADLEDLWGDVVRGAFDGA